MHSPTLRVPTAARLIAVLLAVGLVGCVEDTGPDPESCAALRVELLLVLDVDGLQPADPAVCRDQEVTMVVAAEVDGVFHIHGYDEQVAAAEVRAGDRLRLDFTASRSGQFPIELHPLEDPTGVDIGVFTVHEP